MKRTPVSEAKRKVTLAHTYYGQMLAKHDRARTEYIEKIARLEAEYAALLTEGSN